MHGTVCSRLYFSPLYNFLLDEALAGEGGGVEEGVRGAGVEPGVAVDARDEQARLALHREPREREEAPGERRPGGVRQ